MFRKLWQTAFKEGTLSLDQQLTDSEKAPPTSQACKGRADTDSSQTSDFIYSEWIILITMFVYVYTDASYFKFQVHFHRRSSLAEFQTFNSPMLELLRRHRERFCLLLAFFFAFIAFMSFNMLGSRKFSETVASSIWDLQKFPIPA